MTQKGQMFKKRRSEDTAWCNPLVRKFSIPYHREKGSPTPYFGKFSQMLKDKALARLTFDRERVADQHGGVGMKMTFASDALAKLQQIDQLDKRETIFSEGSSIYINQDVFFGLIFTLDILVFELYSVLDYFALELSEIFGLKVKGEAGLEDVQYFMQLKKSVGMNPQIGQKVKALIKQRWFNYFLHLRNRITHRLPVSVGSLLTTKENKIASIEFAFLPDDPDQIMPTFSRKLNPATEAKTWLEGIFTFVNNVCGDLAVLFSN
jgi:hypothetical protein